MLPDASSASDHDDGHAQFRLSDPLEVRALLRDMVTRSVPVHITGSDGSFYSTVLWHVDGDGGKLQFAADLQSPAAQLMVEAEDAVAVSYLDRVKLQFDVVDRILVHGGEDCVMQSAIPPVLYRFQRRSAFRVRTIERHAAVAVFRHPAIPDMTVELRVLDISSGGCALLVADDVPPLEPGTRVLGAHLRLDDTTSFDCALQLHHVTLIAPGGHGARIGCELHGLSPAASRALQRYIDQTQKSRRHLALD